MRGCAGVVRRSHRQLKNAPILRECPSCTPLLRLPRRRRAPTRAFPRRSSSLSDVSFSSPTVEVIPLYRRDTALTRPRCAERVRAAWESALKPRSSSESETHSCGRGGERMGRRGGGRESERHMREGVNTECSQSDVIRSHLEAIDAGDCVPGQVELGEGGGEAEGGVRGHETADTGRTRERRSRAVTHLAASPARWGQRHVQGREGITPRGLSYCVAVVEVFRVPAAGDAQPHEPGPLLVRVFPSHEQRPERPDADAVAHGEVAKLALEPAHGGEARRGEDAALHLELEEARERAEVERLRDGGRGVASGGGGGAAAADGEAGDCPERVRECLSARRRITGTE